VKPSDARRTALGYLMDLSTNHSTSDLGHKIGRVHSRIAASAEVRSLMAGEQTLFGDRRSRP